MSVDAFGKLESSFFLRALEANGGNGNVERRDRRVTTSVYLRLPLSYDRATESNGSSLPSPREMMIVKRRIECLVKLVKKYWGYCGNSLTESALRFWTIFYRVYGGTGFFLLPRSVNSFYSTR